MLLSMGLFTACENLQMKDSYKDALLAVAPQEGEIVPWKNLGFHWAASKAGEFRFRILYQSAVLYDTLTHEDQCFPPITFTHSGTYTWEVSQGDLTASRTFQLESAYASLTGTYAGITDYYDSYTTSSQTYADQLTWNEVNGVIDVALQTDGGIVGGGYANTSGNLVIVSFSSTAYSAHFEFDTSDSSITYHLYRQRNARGDYETYDFESN